MRGIFDGGAPLINGAVAMLIVTTIVLTIQRLGLVATVVLFLTNMRRATPSTHRAGPSRLAPR